MITTLPCSSTPTTTTKKPTHVLFKVLLLLGFLILGNVNDANAQVISSYTCAQMAITPAFAALPAGKTYLNATSGNIDNSVSTVALPFTFQFGGANYTSVNISMNGFVTFGATAVPTTEVTPISSAVAYSGVISPYALDLDLFPASAAANVTYYTANVTPNRIFKIEWVVKRHNNTAAAGQLDTNSLVFQLWLYETTNVIEMHYNTFNPSSTTITQGQIGLRGSANTDFNNLNYSATANWPSGATTMPSGAVNNATVVLRGTTGQILVGSNRTFRWTPPACSAPSAVTASSVVSNGATISWTAPGSPPSNGYQYEIRTSGAAGSGAGGLVTSGTAAGVSVPITGLTGNTTYNIYVRSDCGGTYSGWTTIVSFTTLCTAANIPYTGMYFDPFDTDGFTVPGLPSCTSIQNVGTGNNWVTDATNEEGFFDEHLMYNASGSNAANVWFFTKGINLVAGTTYRLSYTYGGSTNFSFITNKMQVSYGTSPMASAMTTQLADHPNIKASPVVDVVNFTAPSTGVFYFGFRAYSAANQGREYLDDIEIVPAVCIKPSGVAISSISYNSATANWTAPSPVPSSGYAYYLSVGAVKTAGAFVAGSQYQILTVGTTDYTLIGAASNTVGAIFTATGVGAGTGTAYLVPDNNTVPSGFTPAGTTVVNLSGLTGSTTYYFWVRGNCGSPDNSEWSIVQVFTTLSTPPYCIPGASASTATYIDNVTTTNAITNINNSSVYVAPGYSDYTALTVTESQGGSFNFSIDFAFSGGVGIAIFIDWNGDGDFADAGENPYNSGSYLFASPITGVINVPAGATLGTTRMRVVADYWATSPSACSLSATGPRGEIEDYSFKVVVPPPALTVSSASSIQCAGTNSPLVTITTPLANFDTYSWSPSSGVSGTAASGYTFNSATTLTYTLTGTQTSAPFATNTAVFQYNANALPTAITIATTPSTPTTCQNGPAIQLTASGGVVSGVPVISENFNSGVMTGWTTSNASTGAAPANSNWTIRPDGYVPTGPSWFSGPLHSNDSSNFVFSDSDSNGIGTHTLVDLISPVFSLSGYTAASLSFWQYYREWSPSTASVQISVNGTAGPWVTLQSYTTVTQGAETAWSHVVLDLSSYVGQANLAIRYDWDANWGWVWGIDNFLVSGSATSAITWTPITGLYSNAAATNPYVAGTGAITVYALPSTSTTYTASASTPTPVCSTSTTASVTITPIVGGTVSPLSQASVCGAAADLILAGSSGTITKWQYATNAIFTLGVTDIAASASATLTSAQIGSFAGTRYYRAVITNGTCTAYSTVVSINFNTTTYTGTWSNGVPNSSTTAIFASGVYSSAGNLNACSVVVSGGTVTFNSGDSMIVQNSVTVSSGSLTFNNNASLVQVNNTANSGYITYKRDSFPMRLYDYTYWSSPLSPQTLVGLSPLTLSDKYFAFDATAGSTGSYVNVAGNSLMSPGIGYIVRSPQNFTATPAVFNGVFNGGSNDGVPNNGNYTVNVYGPAPHNFNLLGNPYPSAIDADLFINDAGNSPHLDGTVYFWTHNTAINPTQYTQSDYAMYNSVGGVGTAGGGTGNGGVPTGKISSGQGFFIKGLNNGTVTFKNSMRLPGVNNQFFRMAGVNTPQTLEKHRVWLEIRNNEGAYKQTLVGYVENATNEKDRNFDGDAVNAGNSVGLYSVLGEDKLGIQGRALPFNVNDLVPIGYAATIAGNYEIALSAFDGLFTDQNIYLEDKVLNVIHDLKSGSYAFSTEAGTFDDRFVLRYTNGTALGVDSHVFDENSVVVYKNESGIHINTSLITMDAVKIFDIRGRLLTVKTGIGSNETTISGLNAEQQVLVIQIKSEDNRIVTKKIVY